MSTDLGRMRAPFLALFAFLPCAVSLWPHVCPNATTRCPAWATCAPNAFSLSGWGCAPFTNATICSAFQSCPSSTACVLSHGSGNASDLHGVYRCISRASGADWGQSRCSCKPGAPLPLSSTLKNVLVVGDSISLGYTPALSTALADVAMLQHAPFSTDGGSEEAAYTLQCLSFWLASPSGERLPWDLVYVNSGMHNSGQGADWIVPGQSGEPAAYAAELSSILTVLVSRAPRVVFGITSPMMCNSTIDAVISGTLNPVARLIADDAGLSDSVVDLYAAVTAACGAVPQASCFGQAGGFCPHSNSEGYAYLAGEIAPVIRSALARPPHGRASSLS